ncbi:MAG: DUF2125 domain-containing protein [Pikeienuella sp.]
MKTPWLIGAGAVGVAALWSAGWFAGRSLYVEPEADRAVAELREGKLFFNYERRDIGGFPFAYDVSYRGVSIADESALWRWTAAGLEIGSGVADAGTLEIRPPAESKLIIEGAALGEGEDAIAQVFDIKAEAPVVRITNTGERADVAIRAAALDVVRAPDAGPMKDWRLNAAGFSLDAAFDERSGEAALKADKLSYALDLSVDQVIGMTTTTELTDIAASFSGDGLDAQDMPGFIAGDGAAEGAIETGAQRVTISNSGGPGQPPYTIGYEAASSRVAAALGKGRVRYEVRSGGILYSMKSEGDGFAGDIALGATDLMLDMPLRQGVAPYQITLGVKDLTADEALWSNLDPARQLDRAPIALDLDLGGDLRVLADIGSSSLGSPPVDLERLEIRKLHAEALGVTAEASGDVEMSGGGQPRKGEIALDLKGALQLVDKLEAGGLIPPTAAAAFKSSVWRYGRLGDGGPDHILADIRIDNSEMTINGQPVD